MSSLELPHTGGCVACGRHNPLSLRLSLSVDSISGAVTADYLPLPEHIGFEGVVHGGVLATVLDEAMVWSATWLNRRFCLCGELSLRFRHPVHVGHPLKVLATATILRPRLIEAWGELINGMGKVVAGATGKYVPVPAGENRRFLDTFITEPGVEETLKILREAAKP